MVTDSEKRAKDMLSRAGVDPQVALGNVASLSD